MKNRFLKWLKDPSYDVYLFIIALVLLNLVSSRAFLRFDLTSPRSYSLSESSVRVVKNLEEPLSVKVFFSGSLPAPYSGVSQYVKDILSEYKTASGKNFSYEIYNMELQENQSLARNYGLSQAQIQEVKNNEVGLKSVFMGIAMTYADQIKVLDGITTTDGLEYKITSLINTIVSSTNVLSGLSSPIKVSFYKSAGLDKFGINGMESLSSYVEETFNSVNKKMQNKLSYTSSSPSSEEALSLADRYGIQSIKWAEKDGKDGAGALGLVLSYGDAFKTVPLQIVQGFFGYDIEGLENLSESIENGIMALTSHTNPVAYITGHGEVSSSDAESGAGNFAGLLSDRYSLQDVDLQKEDIPFGIQAVMINGPKEPFTEEELYKIDQFLMKGGNLIVFLDPFNVVEPQEQSYFSMPEYIPIKTGLEKLLSKYGIECKNAYALDESCYEHQSNQYGTSRKLTYYYLPLVLQNTINQKHPITKNLGYLYFYQPGVIDISGAKENKNLDAKVLVSTSSKSWTVSENIMLSPMMSPPESDENRGSEDIAVIVEGLFESAFTSPVVSESAGQKEGDETLTVNNGHFSASSQRGKVFVASTSYITTPALIDQNGTQPVAYFLQNAVDYMNGNSDLCTMRTKGLSLSALHTTNGALVLLAQYFNEFGLAVIVVIAGLIVLLFRKRHRNALRLRYDPNNARDAKSSKAEGGKL